MRIKLLVIGKTDDRSLVELIENYQKRLHSYVKFQIEVIPSIKNAKKMPVLQQKEKEGKQILAKLKNTDQVVLLDEKGQEFNSVAFAHFLQKKMNTGIKQWVLVVGGPYGFSESVYKRATEKVSLSKMTFSHQMVRLFLLEQLYRGFTILNNEPYHHL